jgi:hypothetical protein
MSVVTTSRAKLIKQITETKKAKTGEQMKISYGGSVHPHPVYKIPLANLIYNIRNGRFRAELLAKEEELKRKLDSTNKKDAEIIQQLLLNQDENETKILKEDLIRHGQIDPGIITSDGAVINANRRMAILSDLKEKTGEENYGYLKVGILPSGIDTLDLWRIEAGLQFGKDFRLKYGGVNELLKLKEGIKQGLKPQDISAALLGRYSKKQVEEKLEILKLIDTYLEFIGKKGEYHRIHDEGLLEKFISGYKAINGLEFDKNRTKDLIDIHNILFLLIEKTDIRHLDVRELKNIGNNPTAFKELKKNYDSLNPRKISNEKMFENFETALEISNAKKDEGKPLILLNKALSNLEAIDPDSDILKTEESQEMLRQILKTTQVILAKSK